MEDASVSATLNETEQTLYLRFDSKDVIVAASFEGKSTPWLTSLCFLLPGKNLAQALDLSWSDWEDAFKDDQSFWDIKEEASGDFLQPHLELLRAALDIFRGRDYLYHRMSPLVCRCFGVRESDLVDYLKKTDLPTLEGMGIETKAGMGCRSCVSQLKRWVTLPETKDQKHYYKERPISEWLLDIDERLSDFKGAQDWKMEIASFKKNVVLINYDKEVSQREEEQMALKVQTYFSGLVDSDLTFFLRRARHLSNADG